MGIISVGRELEGGLRMMSQSEITTRSVRSMGFIDRDQTRLFDKRGCVFGQVIAIGRFTHFPKTRS